MDLEHVYQDLTSRFFINLPSDEFESFQRLFFQLEQAYWFYEDFYVSRFPNLQTQKLKDFCLGFFQHCPFLKHLLPKFDRLFQKFLKYVDQVPVAGCILLSPGHHSTLLIQSNSKSKSWGFPKGKLNHNESNIECAAREVLEEVGYPAVPKQLSDKDSILSSVAGRLIRLYILPDVDMSFSFKTSARFEIRDIRWFKVADLPTFSASSTRNSNSMRMVEPFMSGLMQWIKKNPAVCKSSLPTALKIQPRVSTWADVQKPLASPVADAPRPPRERSRKKDSPKAGEAVAMNAMNVQLESVDTTETFGAASTNGWGVEEMFRANANLGVRSEGVQKDITEEERKSFRAWLRGEVPTPTPRSASTNLSFTPQNTMPTYGNGKSKSRRRNKRRGAMPLHHAASVPLLTAVVKGKSTEMPLYDTAYDAEFNNASTNVPAPLINFQFDSSQIMMAFAP
eukprot:g34430.t1